jgi:outer membrane protein OmpA-like peptidoglycan-associated protein
MSPHRTRASRLVAGTSASVLLVLGSCLGTGVAHAAPSPAPEYSEPPDNIGDAAPPVDVDPQAAGLRLADGARLAPAKVLDIKFVTEDMAGEERRADSNTKTTFTLQAEVLFSKDSAKLNGRARGRIADMAEEIQAQHATEVNVFGFTDDLGSYAHGEVLSKARAAAVQQELAGQLGPDVTYRVRGYSEDYPIADNSTESGRKKNRRVEVSFPRKD